MSKRSTSSGPKVSIDTYRDDKLYPRIVRAVDQILAKGKVVAPVDVLVQMDLLEPKRFEDWRRGRVTYLEKVIGCNLTRLSRLLRILRFHAHDLNLVPSVTAYMRWGKGPKERLRFTKTGDPKLEEAYARHFVWPGKGPFHPPLSKHENPRDTGSGGGVKNSPAKEPARKKGAVNTSTRKKSTTKKKPAPKKSTAKKKAATNKKTAPKKKTTKRKPSMKRATKKAKG